MKLYTLASSSRGNCALVSQENYHILVDAGISMRRISTALQSLGLALQDLSAVLVTHAHNDHAAGLPMLAKYAALPVHCSAGTARELATLSPALAACLRPFEAGEAFNLGCFQVQSFPTPHDRAGSVGFSLACGAQRLSFVTDLGYITQTVLDCVAGSDLVVLESNHDVRMLEEGLYPPYLKRRILGNYGHLSNDACSQMAVALAQRGTKQIILSHLSRDNNSPELARRTTQQALTAAGQRIALSVAPKDELSDCFLI